MKNCFSLFLLLGSFLCSCENNRLKAGEILEAGDCLVSNNRKFKLVLRKDGNLVLFKGKNEISWISETRIDSAGDLKMEETGDLVLRRKDMTPYWRTHTSFASGAEMILNDEGDIIVQAKDSVLWSSGDKNRLLPGQMLRIGEFIESKNKIFKLVLQKDGNLVLYKKGSQPVWSTKTWNKPVKKCVMQRDGNLVLYDDKLNVYWSSKTAKMGNCKLLLQDNGNLAILKGNSVLWSSDAEKTR